MADANADTSRLVISYLPLRTALGFLGMALPVILAVGCACCGTCIGPNGAPGASPRS